MYGIIYLRRYENSFYILILACIKLIVYDLSPNHSPSRREALKNKLFPLPLQGRGLGG
jgi:hypothetical protein